MSDPEIKNCALCDCPLEIYLESGQVMRYTAHTDEYCRHLTIIRIGMLQSALKRETLQLQRSEYMRNRALSVFAWLDRDLGRIRDLYEACMADRKLEALNWCEDQMMPTREDKLRALADMARAGIELNLPEGTIKELLGK